MINTDSASQIESDGATVNYKMTLERVKKITLMENNSFHSLNVFNTWNIPSRRKSILGS